MSNPASSRKNGIMKIRLTLLCAKNLCKKDFFRLPDAFAKISVDGSGQCHSTDTCRGTLDPKWNQHYDLYVGRGDGINISVWNRRKIQKNPNSGFLGSVTLAASDIIKLKDTGYQRLELTRSNNTDSKPVCGQIIVSLMSRDGRSTCHQNTTNTSSVSTGSDELPEGWEERRTTSGRVYFVNHINRTTHWERPTAPAILSALKSPPQSRHDSALGNIVLSNPNTSGPHDESRCTQSRHDHGNSSACADILNEPTTEAVSSRPQPESVRRRSARHRNYLSRNQLHQPLDLPEGYEMRTTQQGQVYYYNMQSGTSTWHDPRVPRDLGAINADELGQLPPGWELRYTDSNRPYFLNHINRTTQFTDPRLSNAHILSGVLRNLSAVSVHSDSIPDNSNNDTHTEEVPVSPVHSSVQPKRERPSSSRSRGSSPPDTVTVITSHVETPVGLAACPRDHLVAPPELVEPQSSVVIQNNVTTTQTNNEITTAVSQSNDISSFHPVEGDHESLPKYRRDLIAKLKMFRAELQSLQLQSGHCRLDIPRDEIFEESFRQVMKLRAKDLRKRLMVKFRGEEGLDYGGVAREWLYLLSHEMLNPYYGLFQYSRDDIYTLQINPDSHINPEHLAYFHFVGRIIGMAVFHSHYIDGGFTMPFYKMLLNKPIVLDDIQSVDPDLHRSLNWILENELTDIVDLTFSIEHESFGALKVRELKPEGSDIPVTEENKKEYVRLYVNLRFMQGIEQQFAALQKGFSEVVPQQLLAPFDERELELIIGGLGKIDITDWKQNTRLKHCTPETPVVGWFWQIVESYSEEMRARLLQFVTGSSRVPLQGFKALQGSTGAAGPKLFTIHLVDAHTESLPKAHTCFNRIDIPAYPTYEKMLEKLTQSVEETCGFAVE